MKPEEQTEEQSKETSQFNEASFQIARLHQIWLDCAEYSVAGEYTKWQYTLEVAWRELWPDILRLGGKETKENEYCKAKDMMDFGIHKPDKKIPGIKELVNSNSPESAYPLLAKKEQLIRKIQDLAGKGTKLEDGSARDFE